MPEKIAYVFGRPALNAAKLQFMPFGLSPLRKLAEDKNNQIDLYLTQDATPHYRSLLPANVNIIFLDNKTVWSKGSGRVLFYFLSFYFRRLTFFKSYTEVWGIGQAGVVLGGKLAKRKKARFICLNDEFPDLSFLKIWREKEKKYTAGADIVVQPDEARIPVIQRQVTFYGNPKFSVLPNMPLQSDIKELSPTDWLKRLGLKDNAKIVVYAGGIDRENNIELLLSVFPFSAPEFVLVMVGNGNRYKNSRYFGYPRVLWIEEPLEDNELHSLISRAVCCICYYADFMDLEYVGKSSGKIMRSLLAGTPVISTDFGSLAFIKHHGMGKLITKPFELVAAIQDIDTHLDDYKKNISEHINHYTFEHYWADFPGNKQVHMKK